MDKIVHFEIPAENAERATQFYKTCFDWEILPIPAMNYTIVRTGPVDKENMPQEAGFISGGIMKRTDQVTSPVLVISVENIQASIEKIKANKGILITDIQKIGDMGSIAYFKDTENNLLALWETIKK